jgi:Ca2+-binding EF-hand superfamily protein
MTLILMKLFIAVILQCYNEVKIQEQMSFNDETIQKFITLWQQYDPDATGYIDKECLQEMLYRYNWFPSADSKADKK